MDQGSGHLRTGSGHLRTAQHGGMGGGGNRGPLQAVAVAEAFQPVPSSSKQPFFQELLASTDVLFRPKLSWLLVLGLIAVFGSKMNILGEATCFMLSGVALIPCAERYDTYLASRQFPSDYLASNFVSAFDPPSYNL